MKHWIKQHDRALKIAITGIAIVVAIVVVRGEMQAQREFNAMTDYQEQDLQANKPFYDCLIAAAAMADENSPREEALAAIEAGDECYKQHQPE